MLKRMEAWRQIYQTQLNGSPSAREAAEENYVSQFRKPAEQEEARERMSRVLANVGHGPIKAQEIEERVIRINRSVGHL